MTRHYTPRKKKEEKPVIKTKIVRIDHRTEIEVSADIPDDVAIERYYARHKTATRPPIVAEVEELQEAVMDDVDLPEED